MWLITFRTSEPWESRGLMVSISSYSSVKTRSWVFAVNAAAGCPELDASGITAGTTAFIVRAAQMDQVASPARLWIDFLCRWVHSRTKVWHRA